jgi:ubiquinone/menaquinone biosynthesis C-methylase UbiE
MSRFKFIKGKADNSLPFPDNYFDTIICIAVIEHVYYIFSLAKEFVKK